MPNSRVRVGYAATYSTHGTRSGRGTHAKCERILRGAWGRVGEEVSDMIDEPKFQFFNCLSPSPLSQRDWNSSRSDKHCLRSKREGLIRRMANSA